MSLSSLRSAAGFANNALDTARSTWKAMADAAVNTDPAANPDETGAPAQASAAASAAAVETGATAPAPRKGVRLGTVLDAYA
jgi:hypothetical protein